MRRSSIVLLIVLALVAGLYWYMQQPENVIETAIQPTATETQVDLGYLVDPALGAVTAVTIERQDAKVITLDKSAGIWLLQTAEGSVPAEPTATDAAANSLTTLRILTWLNPAPDLAEIQLTQPVYTIAVTMTNGTTLRFTVGAKTVTQSGYYVQAADGKVYVVSAYPIDTLAPLIDVPPYLQTPTPSPLPPTATPLPSATPQPSPTVEPVISPTATP